MILPDHEIKKWLKEGKLIIEPLEDLEKQVQPAWVDLKLDSKFQIFKNLQKPFIDTKAPGEYTKIYDTNHEAFILHPKEFVLGLTREWVKIPPELAAYVDGHSSLGRLGITSHITSGWIDPGFSGRLVLEITNIGKMPVKLYPGMKICKLVLFKLASACEVPYDKRKGAKYKEQKEVTASKIQYDFEK
ncbi:MAG: dCTP deaminase [Candidatus Aenigmarchaeota archaeon]|nr:dCTP deaminase [Candidatus Aenigmarchaeota archaeon]